MDDIDAELSASTRAELRAEALDFFNDNYDLISEDISRAGYDFWLTRNGHGAGFWDGDWPEHGDTLTQASKIYGGIDLYVGDDGQIYA